ncbi:hypothetical protein GOP47_0005080 [Adiantum capillus-veneris]|uniref:Calponin-homology (CH) domain-containing protein n=1 Tax=Adiantum capillus-veneris TaxID=13818 RepID=A0A9D4ZNA2_ADICA|nr:hypothetical protein GOP47_0005080 [Adiantum capillus-veneris]
MSGSVPSLPSPKIRFRDLDVEFLQRQARIWLEIIAGERYDPSVSLPSLLADGAILRKVSSKIWELIQKNGDKESLVGASILFPETSANGKHSGRYLPYSNVDTFLKVCQKVGLTGVDLFSSPDVVEEKDIRRVCLCIRALSQKARARNLKVPNFDSVAHNEAAPVGLVAGFKALTQHLSAESMEISDQIKGANGRNTPFMQYKLRRTDAKGSANGSPFGTNYVSSSMENNNLITDKAVVDTSSSNLVDTVNSKPINGLKPLKTPSNLHKLSTLPSSSCEEVLSKSTNDFKATNSDTTVFYEGFNKHKTNRLAALQYSDNKNFELTKQPLVHTVVQYPPQPMINGYGAASTSSSDGEPSSEVLSPAMDSYSVDTDIASQNATNVEEDEEIFHTQGAACGEEDGAKRTKIGRAMWRPVVTLAIGALLGAVFIMQAR